MPGTYLPSTDGGLAEWAKRFAEQVAVSYASWGVSAEQAAELSAIAAAYIAAYQAAWAPVTKCTSLTLIKNDAREKFKAVVRPLVAVIQASPGVTNADRGNLGLTIRKQGKTVIPPPDEVPGLRVVAAMGRTMTLRLYNFTTPTSARPRTAAGAMIFRYVGETPPNTFDEWTLEANVTKYLHQVHFPADMPAGTKVWFCAYWYNPRAQRGPVSEPLDVQSPSGMMMWAA